MNQKLAEKLADLPKKPGVYIFKDATGLVLYVGKAISLRNRVGSYFKKGAEPDRPHIQMMIPKIADMDFTITDNELECLMLESNFIKQLKPKYNIILRDDKNYLFIKITLADEIPTIAYERKANDKQSRYFGPYTSGYEIKNTLRLARKIFPYCANSKVGEKPCFFYHIGKCPGVCFGKITLEEYRERYIKKIIKFLEGKQTEVLKELQKEMQRQADHKRFEKAAKIRDQIFALNRVMERQKIVYPAKVSQDVFSLYQDGTAAINLFIIREGKLIRKENFILDNAKQATAEEIFSEFLPKYYLDATDWPKEVVIPHPALDAGSGSLLSQGWLKRKLKFIGPTRGTKQELIKLGELNARQYLETTTDKHLLEEAKLMSSLRELQRVLNLPSLPARIEAYDISNIQGTNAVGSMIVFDFAKPKKDQYRKFKIKRKNTPDDFAMMSEMLERRFQRSALSAQRWPLPDLILIDGGKGQLNAAIAALKTTNNKLQIPIIGLAKRLEEIFLPGQKNPIILPPHSIALFLLQRVRDEAHRFAVKYHRTLRTRGLLASTLDQIPGIGAGKKKILLQTYGSAAGVRKASLTEIAAIVGAKLAEKIKASL